MRKYLFEMKMTEFLKEHFCQESWPQTTQHELNACPLSWYSQPSTWALSKTVWSHLSHRLPQLAAPQSWSINISWEQSRKKKKKKTWNNSNWQKQNKKQEMKRRNILELILSKVCDSGAQLSHVTCFKTPFQFSLCAASSAASLLFECAHFNQSIPGDRRLKITDPQNSLW